MDQLSQRTPASGDESSEWCRRKPSISRRDSPDSVVNFQKGRAKVTVVSPAGKGATITLLAAGVFAVGGALAA